MTMNKAVVQHLKIFSLGPLRVNQLSFKKVSHFFDRT